MESASSGPAVDSGAGSPTERYFLWTVLVITAITNLSTVRFGFVYDDYPQILFNPFIRAWSYVPQYFVNSVWKHMDPLGAGNYYRPLFLLWMRVNYAAFGSRPFGWHVGVIMMHLIATALVYLTIRKLTGRANLAWMTALIFGLHPIHHEVVAWVSGATESLFAIPFLAAFLAYLHSRDGSQRAWMAASCACYATALLCKETAIVLPALIFAHVWIADSAANQPGLESSRKRLARGLTPVAVYIPIALVYLVVRFKVLSGFGHSLTNVSFSMWLWTLPSVLFTYVKNWFLPIHLSINYDVFYQQHLNLRHVILPAAALAALGCAIWIFRKQLGSREVGYAAVWIAVPLLPALDYVVFEADELVHDRYFYVPSIGAALLIALLIEKFGKSQRLVFGAPAPVIATTFILAVALSMGSAKATSYWDDGYDLFTHAHEVAPGNAIAMNNLSVELIERQEMDSAQALLEQGYPENRGNLRFAFNLGRVAYAKKEYPKAEEYTRQAIAIDPNFGENYVSLGMIQLKQNHALEAQKSFQRAVELNPYDARFHTSYGIVLERNGDCPAAISQFEAALALNPGEGLTEIQLHKCRASETPAPGSASNTLKP